MPDYSVPNWLEKNWTPHQAFDPTPWLQERFRRQERQQEISLRVQEFGLKAQSMQLDIQQQAMANEQASLELSGYREELPAFSDWLKSTGGDPVKITSGPLPAFTNPKLMERAIAIRKSAAESRYVQAVEKYETGLAEVAAELVAKGKNVRPKQDDSGRLTFDPEELAAAASELDEREQQQLLQRIGAQYTARENVELQVKEYGGEKFITNPRTGAVHRIDRTVSRSSFIANNVSRWVSEGLAKDENDAAAKLGTFYDTHISSDAPEPAAAPTDSKTIGGFKVRVIKP